jgi:hypothetical protein
LGANERLMQLGNWLRQEKVLTGLFGILSVFASLLIFSTIAWQVTSPPEKEYVANIWPMLFFGAIGHNCGSIILLFAAGRFIVPLIYTFMKHKQKIWLLLLPIVASWVFCFGFFSLLWTEKPIIAPIDSIRWKGRWFHLTWYDPNVDAPSPPIVALYNCDSSGFDCKREAIELVHSGTPFMSKEGSTLFIKLKLGDLSDAGTLYEYSLP